MKFCNKSIDGGDYGYLKYGSRKFIGIIKNGVKMGMGKNIINKKFPKYYNTGITVIGEYSTIPQNTIIGKNVMIDTKIKETDFKTKIIESGESVINEN